ncbi:MAG: DUF4326 domain-containing protein [Actinomycetota bacterium]|nr:DUF4326 domain-containing protein [Actinomycetota bacterium]
MSGQRIQLRRSNGWRKPAGAIVVARPTRWGNPYVVGTGPISYGGPSCGPAAGFYSPGDQRWCDLPGDGGGLTADQAVLLYRRDLTGSLRNAGSEYDELRQALEELRGHDLACWCPPGRPCHADVLLEIANR